MRLPNPNGLPVSWGLRELDSTLGQMILGRFYLIGARAGNGKTMFAMNWLNHHLDRMERATPDDLVFLPRKIQIFMTERSPDVAIRSWAALRAGLDEDAVLMGEWDDMPAGAEERFQKELSFLNRWHRDSYLSMESLARPTLKSIRERVEEYDPDVILFDHVQRIRADRNESKFEVVSEAAHMFQEFATKGNRIVVVMSQLKRTGDKIFSKYRPPSDEDFKYAGELEENADVVLGLFRPLRRMKVSDEREIRNGTKPLDPYKVHDTMGVNVPKHRWRGSVIDEVMLVRCKSGRIEDFDHVPF